MAYTAAQYKADLAKAQSGKPIIKSANWWPLIWYIVGASVLLMIVAPMIPPVSIPTAIMLSAVLLYYKK